MKSLLLHTNQILGANPSSNDIIHSSRHFSVISKGPLKAHYFSSYFVSEYLETLTLYKMIGIGTILSQLCIASNTLNHLYTLHLNEPVNLQEKDLVTIVSFCIQLVDLKITNSLAVTDDLMYNLPTKNRIKIIDLSESRLLTDSGVKALVKSQGGSLEKLVLFGCKSISPFLAAWATEQLRKNVVKSRCT